MMIYAILSLKNYSGNLNALLVNMQDNDGMNLEAVSFDGIAAVVSNIEKTSVIADKSNAIAYAGVIETLMPYFTLLPMRYGSIMESTVMIEKMLERNHDEIQQILEKVENKFEFGLKIFCDSEKLRSELSIKMQEDTIAPTNHSTETINSVFREYVNKKLKEHRLEELMLTYVDSVAAGINEYLDRWNAISKFKKMSTAANIIDAVFLLDKDKKEALIRAVEDLQKQHASLTFILTGPWPPYNFVDFTIK